MLSIEELGQDDLRNCFAFLSVQERIKCSAVCKRWRYQLEIWPDINQLFLGLDTSCFASESVSSVVEPRNSEQISVWKNKIVPLLLQKCPNVRVLVIDNRDLVDPLVPSLKKLRRIHTLVLSHDFFSLDFRKRTPAHLKIFLGHPRLKHLFVLCNNNLMPNKSAIFTLKAAYSLSSAHITDIVLQGILLGSKVIEFISQKYHKSLKRLMIGGVVCDSRKSEIYIKAFSRFQALESLQIPSSVFALSHEPLPRSLELLKNLKSLKRLDVAVVEIDLMTIKHFITTCLPANIQFLYLIDNCGGGGLDITRLQNLMPSMKIFYISGPNSRKFDLPWMNNESNLIYRPYWLPPYFHPIENFSVLMSNQMLTAQQRNPQFLHLDFDIDEENEEQILDDDSDVSGTSESDGTSTISSSIDTFDSETS
ncbi:unnamed protein product [Bursaphelenchus xylophilus]|uniref:(pine wood nematode) hypothetical protein n=1 Tax=Bursaphelenchus xylophilus TaxID=6326 RepID=A0A1I7SAG8_BURXY|nr:unnamed protein product [Bursaphelenchus xylophilus]CAG9083907.1 unnamed protein product [Bursaphelenchus xylophilus]